MELLSITSFKELLLLLLNGIVVLVIRELFNHLDPHRRRQTQLLEHMHDLLAREAEIDEKTCKILATAEARNTKMVELAWLIQDSQTMSPLTKKQLSDILNKDSDILG